MGKKVISTNRKAYHEYHIFDKYNAGMVLTGTEIKSIRKGAINLKDSFVRIDDCEVFLYNCHISPYEQGNRYNHDEKRTRKLLLNKKEIEVNEIKQEIDDDNINKMIEEIKKNYVEETEGLPISSRFDILGKRLFEVINRIAGKYYPESKYPIYELTIDEIILFMHYLSNRIGDIFDKPILAPFKKISIAQIFKILDTKKKMEETKAAKVLKKTNATKVTSIVMSGLKYANPVYWVKKLFVGSTINFAFRKISLLIIDIVADETNKTYSKNIFNKERELKKLEIETSLKELEGDEIDA